MMNWGVTEQIVETDDKLIISRQQDVTSLLDEIKDLADVAPRSHGDAGFRLAGRIPLVVAELWSDECGAAIGTKEFAAFVRRKLMDGDFAKLRVKGY